MEAALLDAAFRLVSHSLIVQDARFNLLTTDDARLFELRKQFPESNPQTLKEAHTRAQRLAEVAIDMADLARGSWNDNSGPPLDAKTLEAAVSGFLKQELRLGNQRRLRPDPELVTQTTA